MLKLSWNLWIQLRAQEELCQNLLPFVCSMLVSVLLNILNFSSQAIHRYSSLVLGMRKWTQTFRIQNSGCCGMNQRSRRTNKKFRIIFQTPWNVKKRNQQNWANKSFVVSSRRKSQACNTKCINPSTRLKYEFQSLHNFNFSEKEQNYIQELRTFKKKMNHQVPYWNANVLFCHLTTEENLFEGA